MLKSMERIEPGKLQARGSNLHRPECVVATPSGDVHVSDWRGGVTVIRADGAQQSWLANDHDLELRPNGIGFDANGHFLIANLGAKGGVWRLDTQGDVEAIADRLDGRQFPPANFAWFDNDDRIWVTISTLREPRQAAWRPDIADGLIVLIDSMGARIVAGGLHYTNEVRTDPSGNWLYVVETFGQRLVRFPVRRDGLGVPEMFAQFTEGFFPDGFAFDEAGNIWVTSLVSNTIEVISPDQRRQTVLQELNAEHANQFQRDFERGSLAGDALGPIPAVRLQHTTSLAFGGPDAKQLSIGCLHNACIFETRVEVAGAPLRHWHQDLP